MFVIALLFPDRREEMPLGILLIKEMKGNIHIVFLD